MPDIDPVLQGLTQKCIDDFEFFAKTCLKIRTKDGALKPFILNRGQKYLHERLEKQLAEKGRVRAICLKGRQMGISTYIQGRFYWRLWKSKKGVALNAFILTHEQPATDNLFGMAQLFHDYMPGHLVAPTKAANAKELVFADNGCGYQVATAGTKEVGRSSTIQLFHGSEFGFWPNAESHITSLLQTALSRANGTEAILESTANGVGNVMHRYWGAAVRGDSEYEAIFIPWYWDDQYQEPCPEAWSKSASEAWLEYGYIHKLEWPQLYWAFLKNRGFAQAASLDDDRPCPKFCQEFPATAEEAFTSSGASFIPSASVMRARRPDVTIIGRGPIILGVDPARSQDKVGVIDRCGRRAGERVCERFDPGNDLMYVAARIAKLIDRIRPDAVNIDVGGNGSGVYDRLVEMGYDGVCNAVNFGSNPFGLGPTGEEMYFNRRAEMHDLMRDWFETSGGVQVPDDDALHADLTAAEWGPGKTRYNTSNELIIEEKDKIKERLGHSPDLGDALALTFAVPFAMGMVAQNQPHAPRKRKARTGY